MPRDAEFMTLDRMLPTRPTTTTSGTQICRTSSTCGSDGRLEVRLPGPTWHTCSRPKSDELIATPYRFGGDQAAADATF